VAQDSDWISRYRQATTAWLHALDGLLALNGQYVALDYGNSLTEEDFAGANSDVDKEDITAAVASIDAINTLVRSGHATNLYTLML
jgi:hypothetical protein